MKHTNYSKSTNSFDIIVIGGGHAGIEAAHASAKMGCKTALITMDIKSIGRLSCNPSIGGSAKGHLVKEVDALGGLIGWLGDRSGIQFKMLNTSKGRAVWSPRSQNDKDLYPYFAQKLLLSLENLTIFESSIQEILIHNDKICGIISFGEQIFTKKLIICSGTFLNGVMYTGLVKTNGGRADEKALHGLTERLNAVGLKSGKLKTGTPPRIHKDSINFSKLDLSYGDAKPTPYSFRTQNVKNSILCYSTHTTENTHSILSEGFSESPMYSGIIKGSGPRYCPSIEDKISRFSDKSSHQILLEPEGLSTNSIYVNGFSTSLPNHIQYDGLHSIQGLEDSKVLRYGYAVEYDFFFPYQLLPTLESKYISGLYFAGQVNGTSGYEEAAAQGIIAGINASLSYKSLPPFILKRSEAYIGVLIDDLINKESYEPYRIFTSLAEYRLLLRQDNAYFRLMQYGYKFGLHNFNTFSKYQSIINLRDEVVSFTKSCTVSPADINDYLIDINESIVESTTSLQQIVKRSNVNLADILKVLTTSYYNLSQSPSVEQAETDIKYEGYIQRQEKEIEKFLQLENILLPTNINYNNISSLSNEGREKLSTIRPSSLGQASRIMGVSPSDISILSIYIK